MADRRDEQAASATPAMALIEFASVAAGTQAVDALAKTAAVMVIRAGTYQPGRFAVLFEGTVGDVEESYRAGLRAGAEALVDRVLLPDVHEQVRRATSGQVGDWTGETLGVVETLTMAAALEAADGAVKGARVEIVSIRLGDGLGGKGVVHFAGEQADVEAALAIARERSRGADRQTWTSIIPRMDEALRSSLRRSTRFGDGW